MTVLWFLIWGIANFTGAPEPLRFDPVNAWAGTLLLAIASREPALLTRTPPSEIRASPLRNADLHREM